MAKVQTNLSLLSNLPPLPNAESLLRPTDQLVDLRLHLVRYPLFLSVYNRLWYKEVFLIRKKEVRTAGPRAKVLGLRRTLEFSMT